MPTSLQLQVFVKDLELNVADDLQNGFGLMN